MTPDVPHAHARCERLSPSMIHRKLMIVDQLWSVVSTTNFHMMSFEYLDEINIAVRDGRLPARVRDHRAGDKLDRDAVIDIEWEI